MRKFSKSTVRGKVPQETTLILEISKFPYNMVEDMEASVPKKHLDSSSCFDRIPICDREMQTDRH